MSGPKGHGRIKKYPGEAGAFSVQGVCLLGEEVRHPLRRGGAGAKLRVLRQQLPGGGLGLLEEQGVAAQVRHLQPRQAVLALAEEVAGAPGGAGPPRRS